MKLTEMIELANAGIKAKDVMTLHKAGYTKDMILELSEEQPNPASPEEDSVPKEKESPSEDESIDDKKETKQEPKPEQKEYNAALEQIEKLKKQVADLQEKNRHKDLSGEKEEDPNKHIKEYIASLM